MLTSIFIMKSVHWKLLIWHERWSFYFGLNIYPTYIKNCNLMPNVRRWTGLSSYNSSKFWLFNLISFQLKKFPFPLSNTVCVSFLVRTVLSKPFFSSCTFFFWQRWWILYLFPTNYFDQKKRHSILWRPACSRSNLKHLKWILRFEWTLYVSLV